MPLQTPVSAAARRTMKAAFDKLDHTILPEDSHDFGSISLEHTRKVALAIEDQLAARKSLRNMKRLSPLFSGLEHYAKVVEILCNGTPYLPWIWAPITLVLRIASEYIEAFEKIIRGYAQIAESLGRFKILSVALGSSPDFQETLSVFYANILQYHEHAYTFVRRKSWRLLFLTSWGRFERRFDNIFEDLKRHEQLVDLHANAHSIADIRQMREDITSWRDESLVQINKWHEKRSSKQFAAILAWLKAEETDQIAIFDTISAEASKFANTSAWVLKNSRIRAWLQRQPDSLLLWLQGTAGSGKSVLVSHIVRFMRNANMSLIHHFCSQRYASSTTYEQILRSILLQLLRRDEELTAHVYEDFVLGKQSPTVQALEKLLYNLFTIAFRGPGQSEYVWIIIDGLNECEMHRQSSVVNLINQITNRLSGAGDTICKVLISSRNISPIANRLRAAQTVSLTEEKHSIIVAIRQYVSQRLRAMHDKLAQLEPTRSDIEEIERLITNKADGMFLYARLVLDYLSKNIFYSGQELKDSVKELPEELTEFYRKILLQILVQLDQRSADRIKCIFSWIAYAKRPLKRIEFLSALTFSSGGIDAGNLVPKYVLDFCGALVEERPDTTLAFIHISVKEFLESASSNIVLTEIQATKEHCLSTIACLLCGVNIFFGDAAAHQKALRVAKGIHGLHVYATDYWTEYLFQYIEQEPLDSDSAVLRLSLQLAERLRECGYTGADQSQGQLDPPLDERSRLLEKWPLLANTIAASHSARSLKRLESSLMQELKQPSTAGDEVPTTQSRLPDAKNKHKHIEQPEQRDGISAMLHVYQTIVRDLLKQDQYPGISADDLDLFKSQFQNSAFTCRLSFCPRATVGFSSEELRRQHEIAHTQLSICTVPDCKYPPFPTTRGLQNHINKHHRPQPIRQSIRRVQNQLFLKQKDQSVDSDSSDSSRDISAQGVGSDAGKLVKRNKKLVGQQLGRVPITSASGAGDPMKSHSMATMSRTGVSNLNMLDVQIESIGYRGCSIPGCGARLASGDEDPTYGLGTQQHLSLHYWNWHHADTAAQCSVSSCQMRFASKLGLQAHYEQRHAALFCERCDANHPDGFALEDELRYHWQSHHLRLVNKWICDELKEGLEQWPPVMNYRSCVSCTTECKFDRRYDALEHLASAHYKQSLKILQGPFYRHLETGVRMVRVYEDAKGNGLWTGDNSDNSDDSDSCKEDMNEASKLYYVEDLA